MNRALFYVEEFTEITTKSVIFRSTRSKTAIRRFLHGWRISRATLGIISKFIRRIGIPYPRTTFITRG